MKSIFLPLFGKKNKGQSSKQVAFRRPSKCALESITENYIKWRFPGAVYCYEVKDRPWSISWYHYDPEQNTMELSVLLYIDEDYLEEITVHLLGNAFVG
jgi:hypothetical protein